MASLTAEAVPPATDPGVAFVSTAGRDRPAVDWSPRAMPAPWRRPLASAAWLVLTAVGTLSLALLLAVVAAIPVLNFYALGVLLDVEGRVARSGRLRDGFRLWGVAPRIGGAVLGCWLFLLPLRFLAGYASDAALISPGGVAAQRLSGVLLVAAAVVAIHLVGALARGGRFSTFLRPIRNLRTLWQILRGGHPIREMGRQSLAFLRWLEFRRLWWLGLRGYGVGLTWIVLPTLIYVSAEDPRGGAVLIFLLGWLLLTPVNCWLPLLQANFAAGGRFRDGFRLRTIRRQFNAAPWAWLGAIVMLYVLTLPLHLFRIVLPPADAAWLVTLVFVVTIFPTRLVLGRAAFQGRLNAAAGLRAGRLSRWTAKLLLVVLVGAYTATLYLTQYIGTHGRAVLLEQHAFLLPWPL